MLRSLGTSSPYQQLVRKGTKRGGLCPTFGFWYTASSEFLSAIIARAMSPS